MKISPVLLELHSNVPTTPCASDRNNFECLAIARFAAPELPPNFEIDLKRPPVSIGPGSRNLLPDPLATSAAQPYQKVPGMPQNRYDVPSESAAMVAECWHAGEMLQTCCKLRSSRSGSQLNTMRSRLSEYVEIRSYRRRGKSIVHGKPSTWSPCERFVQLSMARVSKYSLNTHKARYTKNP